ncbi:MAG: hypothetical protein IKB04_02110 [Clostridia bacterium]|nr:hypothetical protein [Clostridia bacterium]
MSQALRIGYFEHYARPPYVFADFLREQGFVAEKIDFSQRGYLENFDVVFIEQNGFNDYIENDERYVHDWIRRGGILLFMHQDYKRLAPYFLPQEVGYIQLIHRYIETINGHKKHFTDDTSTYMTYLMPWIEECGQRLFNEPEQITPDEMLHWKVMVNSFGMNHTSKAREAELARSTALSCYLLPDNWEILGSFMDPAVRDGALIARAKCGKGMVFLNQLLFPEVLNEDAERCLAFWRKYIKNLFAYCERFKNGESEELPVQKPKTLPIKKNYKLAIHMHSLDWYAADSAPGTINAIMRYMGYDICSIAIKDNAPYGGKLDPVKYSDDKVLFLDGQEYHPFNWNDRYADKSHNTYHYLAIGIDPDAYTTKYTCSRFSDDEVNEYLKEAVDYVHEHGGVICATHPNFDYWYDYDIDAVDREPMVPLSGSPIEAYWLSGRRIPVMNSVDLYGPRRILDNPAVNFIYLNGEVPCRDSVVKAIRAGHTIASAGFDEADITLNGYLPGDEISKAEAAEGVVSITATVGEDTIRKLRVYSGAEVIYAAEFDDKSIDVKVPLKGLPLDTFIRVEIEGRNDHWIANSTPFYLV